MAELVLMEISTLNNFELSEELDMYVCMVEVDFQLEPYSYYRVHWNGKEYGVECRNTSAAHGFTGLIGNAAVVGEYGDNEPFLIGTTDSMLMIASYWHAGPHTFGIFKIISEQGQLITEEIMPEQEIEGFSSTNNTVEKKISGSLILDADCYVKWDDVEYNCKCYTLFSIFPNPSKEFEMYKQIKILGNKDYVKSLLSDSEPLQPLEPFIIAEIDGMLALRSLDSDLEKNSHKIGVIQNRPAEAIALTNENGEQQLYYNITSTTFDTNFQDIKQTYTKGSIITQPFHIAPFFKDGDQVIDSNDAILFKKIIFNKPSTLIPENILKGVNIAGVDGILNPASATPKAINFYDIYGNIIFSYTREEAQSLTTLPEVPEVEGYDSGYWNYTLDKIKDTKTFLNIGPRYMLDGKQVILSVIECQKDDNIIFNFYKRTIQSGGESFSIFWGDGLSESKTITKINTTMTINHTYQSSGRKIIGIVPESGKAYDVYLGAYTSAAGGSTSYSFVGNVTSRQYKLLSCSGGATAGSSCFYHCYCLKYLDINLSTGSYACSNCYRLLVNTYPSWIDAPNSAFVNCYSLQQFYGTCDLSSIFQNVVLNELQITSGSNVYFKGVQAKRVIILGTTPGYSDISTASQTMIQNIYVPDESIEDYKANSYWSALADIIMPLSSYPDY